MSSGWFLTLKSSFLSIILHIAVIILLIISFTSTPEPVIKPQQINIVEAVSVDKKQVEKELSRLKKAEQEKLDKEKKDLEALRKKAADEKKSMEDARKKRQEEEKRLKLAEEKKAATEIKKAQEIKKLEELEKQRIIEEKKKQQAEEERIKAEADAREAEKKRQEEEEKRKAEEAEKKRQEQEQQLLQEQIEAEEKELQLKQDTRLIQKIAADIRDKVTNYFNKANLPDNLECKLRVKLLPGGDVINVAVDKSSGNDIFDRRAVNAVQKASPLPVPGDLETFERLDIRDMIFTFKP